jgi:hypothetical protein
MKSLTITLPTNKEEAKEATRKILGRISHGLKRVADKIDTVKEA